MGFSVSTYLVRGTLVDTGFPDVHRDVAAVLDSVRPAGVIVTHYHEDHAGNAGLVVQRGLPLWMPPSTLGRLRDPAPLLWYRRWCWGVPEPLTGAITPFEPPPLACMSAPGHSDDHHVVWDPERSTMFGADLFLGVKVRVSHPWPRENVRQQITSIRQVIALKPERFFDAHRGLVPNAVGQLTAKADWIEETAGRVDALVADGLDDRQIVKRVFGREDWLSYPTQFDYSRRNFVASVRATRLTQ